MTKNEYRILADAFFHCRPTSTNDLQTTQWMRIVDSVGRTLVRRDEMLKLEEWKDWCYYGMPKIGAKK